MISAYVQMYRTTLIHLLNESSKIVKCAELWGIMWYWQSSDLISENNEL